VAYDGKEAYTDDIVRVFVMRIMLNSTLENALMVTGSDSG
jgi:hypothetical protein